MQDNRKPRTPEVLAGEGKYQFLRDRRQNAPGLMQMVDGKQQPVRRPIPFAEHALHLGHWWPARQICQSLAGRLDRRPQRTGPSCKFSTFATQKLQLTELRSLGRVERSFSAFSMPDNDAPVFRFASSRLRSRTKWTGCVKFAPNCPSSASAVSNWQRTRHCRPDPRQARAQYTPPWRRPQPVFYSPCRMPHYCRGS